MIFCSDDICRSWIRFNGGKKPDWADLLAHLKSEGFEWPRSMAKHALQEPDRLMQLVDWMVGNVVEDRVVVNYCLLPLSDLCFQQREKYRWNPTDNTISLCWVTWPDLDDPDGELRFLGYNKVLEIGDHPDASSLRVDLYRIRMGGKIPQIAELAGCEEWEFLAEVSFCGFCFMVILDDWWLAIRFIGAVGPAISALLKSNEEGRIDEHLYDHQKTMDEHCIYCQQQER